MCFHPILSFASGPGMGQFEESWQASSLLALSQRLLLDRLGALSLSNGQAGGLRGKRTH
jgi:hypothetical protein